VTPEEIDAFLSEGSLALVGVVGTTRRDGAAHVVPVWYSWDGSLVRVWTDQARLWVRNLLRDPRVAFSVQENSRPFGAVTMRGQAEVVVNGPDWPEEVRGITRRYLAAGDVEDYVAAWSSLRAVVRIRPVAVRGWSRGY
jgi:PPOX class probable F420-dependent enzyme